MRRRESEVFLLVMVLLWAFLAGSGAPPAEGAESAVSLPFKPHVRELSNGLKVVVVPTDTPGVMAYYTVVRTGSRNEVEKGKTGFAHFFEHMMFRGSKNYSENARKEILAKLGSEDNAFTTQDMTVYSTVTQSAALAKIAEIEADRFANLDYTREAFKTEAGAILGEYNTSASSPGLLINETLLGLSFERHPYRHTVMGFLDDIKAMPQGYEYSKAFFRRYYTPDNAAVIIVGDVEPAAAFSIVEKAYQGWKRRYQRPEIPEEPPRREEKRKHIQWGMPTLPKLTVAYRVPSARLNPAAAADLTVLSELAFGAMSPLYKNLVLDERAVARLRVEYDESTDPGLFTLEADLFDADDLPAVEKAVTEALGEIRTGGPAPTDVAEAKEHLVNQRLSQLDTPPSIAYWFGRHYGYSGDPLFLEKSLVNLTEVTPSSVQATVATHLVPANRTVVTLTGPETRGTRTGAARGRLYRMPSASDPNTYIRLVFLTGSADDPPGKEGLTALTAGLVAKGGTRKHDTSEVTRLLYPLAAELDVHVDKEMTVFSATLPSPSAATFMPILREILLSPGFRTEDFQRQKDAQKNRIRMRLRSTDDENLGKQVLESALYVGHPFGHLIEGSIEDLAGITQEDARAHWERVFTADRLLAGIAGSFTEETAGQLEALLADLPRDGIPRRSLAPPADVEATRVLLVEKPGRSTAISIGFPLDITPAHEDYPALRLAAAYFGEHRQMHGRLFRRLRALRGLNYGDYAYVTHYVQDRWRRTPRPNIARSRQYFSIWIRPVENRFRLFTLKAALWELTKLVREGLTQEDLDRTRDYLQGSSKIRQAAVSTRLGLALDDVFYETPDSLDRFRRRWGALTLEEVNKAIRAHLRPDRLWIVAVTADADALAEEIARDRVGVIDYESRMPPEVLAEDKAIGALDLGIEEQNIRIVKPEELFERSGAAVPAW